MALHNKLNQTQTQKTCTTVVIKSVEPITNQYYSRVAFSLRWGLVTIQSLILSLYRLVEVTAVNRWIAVNISWGEFSGGMLPAEPAQG